MPSPRPAALYASHAILLRDQRQDVTSGGEGFDQLVLCLRGDLHLTGPAGSWGIPEGHMVFIPSDRPYRLRTLATADLILVRFCKGEVDWQHDGCWVCPGDAFSRQLLEHGLKWNADAGPGAARGAAFFVTLGDMVPDWFRKPRMHWTPVAGTAAIQRLVELAHARGPGLTLPEAARHAGMSERTLRRRMQDDLGQSWREFMRELRMKRAMELLRAQTGSIIEIAFETGFASSSAFSHAFSDYVGTTPSAYMRTFGRTPRGAAEGRMPLRAGASAKALSGS